MVNIVSQLVENGLKVMKAILIGCIGTLVTISGIEPASTGIEYPLSNGQVVRFQLDNGQAINLTGNVNNGIVNSWAQNTNDASQNLRVVSDGVYYLFVRNNSAMGLSSQTLIPSAGEQMVTYTSGNGRWQNFVLDNLGGGRWLIRWQHNQNMCVNIPGGVQNVRVTLYPCNPNDPDQRFGIVTTGGLPAYVNPVPHNFLGVLESQSGQRLSLPSANTAPTVVSPNNNDASQRIRFLQSGSSYILQRDGASYALSSNTLDYVGANRQGMAMTTYTSGFGRWQSFGFVDLGGGWYSIKWQFHPNYCISAGTTGSGVGVIVPCNTGDNRQRFRFGGDAVVYQYLTAPPEYEYWIVARKQEETLPWRYLVKDAGHAFTAIVRRNMRYSDRYVNGAFTGRVTEPTSNWYVWHTYGFWPGGLRVDVPCSTGSVITQEGYSDCANTNSIISYNYIPYSQGWAVRKARVSESRANYIHANLNFAGCSSYPALGLAATTTGGCNCLDYATRSWYLFSANREDFRPAQNWSPVSPNTLVDLLNDAIVDGGYLDNGRIWQ
jgi:hypothetical protein